MEIRYFYVSPDAIHKDKVIIAGEEYHHLCRVLRKKSGDLIHVIDGKGNDYLVELERVGDGSAVGTIIKKLRMPNETATFFAIGAGIIKGERMDIIFEKATEMGVSAFYPIISQRTVINPEGIKLERWKRIVKSAVKQSRRSILPYVSEPLGVPDFLKKITDFDTRILLDEEGEISFWNLESWGNRVLIVVGPEGSFTRDEKDLFKKYNFLKVKMGERIMRTETALLVGVAISMFLKKEV
jgi:16S rRNA (uracil1498-N3)-methyltransferase